MVDASSKRSDLAEARRFVQQSRDLPLPAQLCYLHPITIASSNGAHTSAVKLLGRKVELRARATARKALSPGGTVTPGLASVLTSGSSTPSDRAIDAAQRDAIFASFATQIPLGRIGDAAETAAVAVFLASEDSSYMTGSEVFVDGGYAQV